MSPIGVIIIVFSSCIAAVILAALPCGYFGKLTCKNCDHHCVEYKTKRIGYKQFEDTEIHYCTKADKKFKLKTPTACEYWKRPWEY